jgi:hypothetical protein
MDMFQHKQTQGSVPIIAIIAGLVALGGVGLVLSYIMNNEPTLAPIVEEVKDERAAQAQEDGYPSLWIEAGLPQYPNGSLTKTRQGRDLADGVQVTLETTDAFSAVASYLDTEMSSLGFAVQPGFAGTEYATMIRYASGPKILSVTMTKIGEGPMNKIHFQYQE